MSIITIAVIYVTFFIFLAIFCLLSKFTVNQKNLKKMLVVLTICLGIIAFSTYPSDGTDLNRYYVEVNLMRILGPDYAFSEGLYHTTPVANFLFYIVSCTNVNNLLPCISALILFLFVFVGSIKLINQLNISVKYFFLFFCLFIAVCSLRAMLTGVRQGLACSIMAMAVILDLVLKKNKAACGVLYLCAILVHMGILPVLLVRFLMFGLEKSKMKILLIFWSFLIPLMDFLADNSNEYIEDAYNKILGYGEIEYPDQRLLIAKSAIFLILFILAIYASYKKENNTLHKFQHFYLMLSFFTIGAYGIPHLYERMITFSCFISLPVLYGGLNIIEKKKRQFIVCIFLFIIAGLLAYWCIDLKTSWRLTTVIYN